MLLVATNFLIMLFQVTIFYLYIHFVIYTTMSENSMNIQILA